MLIKPNFLWKKHTSSTNIRHVPKSKNLGGHVVMRRAAAAGGAFWSAKIWGGMCPPCLPLWHMPEYPAHKWTETKNINNVSNPEEMILTALKTYININSNSKISNCSRRSKNHKTRKKAQICAKSEPIWHVLWFLDRLEQLLCRVCMNLDVFREVKINSLRLLTFLFDFIFFKNMLLKP